MLHPLLQKLVYPKLILLCLCIALAYILFQVGAFEAMAEKLNHRGYLSIFIAGCLFSYGFTAPFAVGIFLALANSVSPWVAAPLAALGSLLSDLLIFSWIQVSFKEEFQRLLLTRPLQAIKVFSNNRFRPTLRKYLLWTLAGFIIGSPLPDEIGVTLLSGFSRINKTIFSLISYTANMIGIGAILLLGKA